MAIMRARIITLLLYMHIGVTIAITTPSSSQTNVSTDRSATNAAGTNQIECSLSADKKVSSDIKHLVVNGAKLIRYNIVISDIGTTFKDDDANFMYQPLFWARSTGRQGTSLLLLRPNFDRISLQSLQVGVKVLSVNVIQHPEHCLGQLGSNEKELLLRKLVMNDFQNTTTHIMELTPENNVCNQHIFDDSGTADFRYFCCNKNEYHDIECKYLEKDIWIDILFTVITLLEVIVFLFSPRLVPEVLYRVKHIACPYIHKLLPGKKIVLNTTMTAEPDRFPETRVSIELSTLREMENFKKYLSTMKMEETRQIVLDNINLKVKHDRVLSEDYAPVGILTAIYDSFFRCTIRRRSAVKGCCDANFMGKSPCGKSCSWYTVLRSLMRIFLLLLLTVPWLLRVWAYYEWEHDEMTNRKNAARSRNLSLAFPGNFTLLITPIHVLFLCIYAVLVVETLIFGILGRKVQEKLKMVIRQCFRDMREISKREVFGWVVKVFLKPCEELGGLGIFVGLVYWCLALPVLLLIVAFYVLPTLNITIRLMFYFVVNLCPKRCFTRSGTCGCLYRVLGGLNSQLEFDSISKHNILNNRLLTTFSNRILQLFVIFMCLISMYSIIFLIMELVSFVVEMVSYTMMGIILNSGTLMTYTALIIIVGLYGQQVFGNVTDRFMCYNKKLHEVIVGTCKEKVDTDVFTNTVNECFVVSTPHLSEVKNPIELTRNDEGVLQWNVKRLCLFLSKNDEPLIPSEFYFRACRMPYYAAPGELLISYLFAVMEFGAILLFLIFVLIVVMAFGDAYDLSVTNQLLATVFGGLIPFMFRKVFKPNTYPTIDEGSIHFQTSLNDLLEPYEEGWPVYDVDINNGDQPDIFSEKRLSENNIEIEMTSYQNNTQSLQVDQETDYTVDLLIDARKIDPDYFPDILNGKSGNTSGNDSEFQMTITDTESIDGEINVTE